MFARQGLSRLPPKPHLSRADQNRSGVVGGRLVTAMANLGKAVLPSQPPLVSAYQTI